MNQNIIFLMGLQMPENITIQEIKTNLTLFNETLKTNNKGYLRDASLHEKKTANNKKVLIALSVVSFPEKNIYDILTSFPQLENYKRYIITEINTIHISRENSFEQFINHEIIEANMLYQPSDAKPTCLLKAMYNHHHCISGDVIWFNNNPVSVSKGKFYARQLYCELCLDAIKTANGFKISSDSTVFIDDETVMPHFQDKQLVLPVEEINNENTIPEIMTTNYKLVTN